MDNVDQKHMPHKLLYEITDGFSEKRLLGRGAFGAVYKGIHKDGQEIAVKLLHQSMDLDGNAFSKEFNNLTNLDHPNIVRLVGYCNEEEKLATEHNGRTIIATKMRRALCFEYLPNGSLQKHLFDEHQGFDWQKRFKIIKGICMGLKYLHVELESPVRHLDLKPDNILLDNNMMPKIGDFGLSRLLGEKNTIQTINPVGTWGYCPPEFIKYQIISKQFDIFSLGVIIIKIMCGPAGHTLVCEMKPAKFLRQVQKKWRKRLRAIPGYTSLEVDCQQVKKCMEIALKCIDDEKQRRPDIEYIVEQLTEVECLKRSSPDIAGTGRGKNLQGNLNLLSELPRNLPASFCKEITNSFSPDRIIGQSTFGALYKGTLPDGSLIAVKKIDEKSSTVYGKTFDTEVTNLMAVQHENMVQLVGFCNENEKKVIEHNGRFVIVDVNEMFLCYKYPFRGSLDKHDFSAETSTIDWDIRFKIIKGVCEGIRFLHTRLTGPVVHMNLEPNSIWLDDNWVPKIADFGLSRLFGNDNSRIFTVNIMGNKGYLAPEYIYRGEISTMADIYSLGMLILEIVTGEKNCCTAEDRAARKFIFKVHENWNNHQIASAYPSLDANGLQQVKACISIGLMCVELDRSKRPSIVDIVNKLNGKSIAIFDEIRSEPSSQEKITAMTTALLDVYPPQLRFPFKPDKLFSCPLRLTNMTGYWVAARLLTKNPKRYVAKTPLCGVVPPNSTYTLVVTMREPRKQHLLNGDEFLMLESSIIDEGDLCLKNADLDSATMAFNSFFGEANSSAKVHKQTLKVVSDSYQGAASDKPFQSEIEVVCNRKFVQVLSVDVHPTEPWILTSHPGGDILIWDYVEQETESSFDFTQNPVYSAKFIEREEWLVAGDGDGTIYVYSYETDEEVTSIEAHEGDVTSLAVHPTSPFLLSSSDDRLIKLWDWEKGWECSKTFKGHTNRVTQVIFNPVDTDSFVSASLDRTIRIWNTASLETKTILTDDPLLCVHNYTSDFRHHLITGSWNGTSQVWDLQTESCVQTLEGHVNRISCVYRHPELPVVITGSYDGTVRLWNSTTYRLENIIGVNLGAVYSFGYIKDFRRIVVGCHQGIAIVELN